MRKRFSMIIVVGLGTIAVAWLILPRLRSATTGLYRKSRGTYTIEDRLEQYGSDARSRLVPSFNLRQLPYPPARLVLVGLKHEKQLEVYAAGKDGAFHFIRSYPILAASGGSGPKLRQGDRQVPEGVYGVESLNPNSLYHLALRVNYPNDFDRAMASRDGRDNLGGDIMIHGSNGSIGCLAMGDEAAEDLFVLAADTGVANIKVVLTPVDFRKDGPVTESPTQLPWVANLYKKIKNELYALSPATD